MDPICGLSLRGSYICPAPRDIGMKWNAYNQSSIVGQVAAVVIMQASGALFSDWLKLLILFYHLHISRCGNRLTVMLMSLKQHWNKSKTFQRSFSVLFRFRFTRARVWNTISPVWHWRSTSASQVLPCSKSRDTKTRKDIKNLAWKNLDVVLWFKNQRSFTSSHGKWQRRQIFKKWKKY